jgi:hypothetical protein
MVGTSEEAARQRYGVHLPGVSYPEPSQ